MQRFFYSARASLNTKITWLGPAYRNGAAQWSRVSSFSSEQESCGFESTDQPVSGWIFSAFFFIDFVFQVVCSFPSANLELSVQCI